MIENIWGLFLYTIVSGIGFDVSHSLTDLDRSYFSKDACVKSAKTLNMKPIRDKQIGLDSAVAVRYVCILKPKNGLST